jgi:glycosyltransferase involved in cell wall biosynthesis
MEKVGHLKQADLLLSISESSRNESIQHGLQTPERVVNISTAVDIAFARIQATSATELRSKFSISEDYLLYTGASDPRKNLPRLIEAFARLPETIRASHQLVLGGGMPADHADNLHKSASGFGLKLGSVILTGHISDNDMVGLYAGAKAFVFPSYHEGFGLPVLEAMQFGIPCVASDRTSVPEVVGMPEALFDPFSVEAIGHALNKVLVDEEFRKRFKAHCPRQVTKFSWEATAARALEALRSRFGSAQGEALPATSPDPKSVAVTTLCRRIAEVKASGSSELWSAEALQRLAIAVDRSLPRANRTRQVFVDVSALHHHNLNTGIQRVVRNVLRELPSTVGSSWNVVPVYSAPQEPYRVSEKVAQTVMGRDVDNVDPCPDPRAGDIFLGLDLNDVDVARHANFFQHLRGLGVGVYFVVYDLLPFLLPDCFSDEVCQNYLQWLRVVSRSDGLVGISRAVADELLAAQTYVGSPRRRPLQIGWFHLGADFQRAATGPASLRAAVLDLPTKPFFLVVATIEPRKGHAQVVEACEQLWRDGLDFQLVFAGKQGWMVEELSEKLRKLQKSEARFLWFEDLNDTELEHAYRHASGLIAASLGEGYGLPIVEALHHHCPVIARDIPVFREIGGEHVTYFSGTALQSLAAAIKELCVARSDQGKRRPLAAGLIDWRQSTKQLWSSVGGNLWYDEWKPPPRWVAPLFLSLPATDQRFGTQIGELATGPDRAPLIVSRGDRSGFLLHGPYIALPPGRFKVSAVGTLESSDSGAEENYFDVATKKGTHVVVKGGLECAHRDHLFSADIETQEHYSDLEIRIHVGRGAQASVKRISIRQLQNQGEINP